MRFSLVKTFIRFFSHKKKVKKNLPKGNEFSDNHEFTDLRMQTSSALAL